MELETARLILRNWKESDLVPFARMNSDPTVMKYFPTTLSTEGSNRLAEKIKAHIDTEGWGLWAVERKDNHEFIGFVGLSIPMPDVPVKPGVEIGWRLAKEHWGQGFATEAAQEVLKFAFETLNLPEVISFTAQINLPSQAVMRKIGLVDSKSNFMHPRVPVGNALREHVLFCIKSSRFRLDK